MFALAGHLSSRTGIPGGRRCPAGGSARQGRREGSDRLPVPGSSGTPGTDRRPRAGRSAAAIRRVAAAGALPPAVVAGAGALAGGLGGGGGGERAARIADARIGRALRADGAVVGRDSEVLVDARLVAPEPGDAAVGVADVGGRGRAVGVGHAGLAVELAAVVVGAGAGCDVEDREVEEVADLVVLVDRLGLVVDVVEEPLHPGVAGRAVRPVSPFARASTSTARSGSSMSRRNLLRLSATEKDFFDALASALTSSLPLRSARRPTTEVLPRAFSPSVAERLNAGRLRESVVSPGAASRRSAASGVPCTARLSSSPIVGPSSARKSSSRAKFCERSSRRPAAIWAVFFASSMNLTTSWRRSARRPMIRSEFAFRSRIVVFWLASSFVTCAGLLQGRRPAADRLVQVLSIAGQGGAELVDQQRQPLPERQPEGAQDQVVLNRLPGLGDRDVGCLDPLVVAEVGNLDRIALRRAVDEVLGDQRLRLAPADRAVAEHRHRAAQLDPTRPRACWS